MRLGLTPREIKRRRFVNLLSQRATGVGVTEFQINTLGIANWPAKLAAWKAAAGIRVVRVNKEYTLGDSFTLALVTACYNADVAFWSCGLDDGPAGIENFVTAGEWTGLQGAYGTALGRMHAGQLVKARLDSSGIAFLKAKIAAFWTLIQPVRDCVWLSLGNAPENWYQHVFRGNKTPPFPGGADTGVVDSSTYGGFMQITDEGQVAPTAASARSTLETALGSAAPSDANIRTNIPIANAEIRTGWKGQFFGGVQTHAYWQEYGDGLGDHYYYGETGDSTNAAVLSEYGVPASFANNLTQLQALAKYPSAARIIIHWPDGAPLAILDDAGYAGVCSGKSTSLGSAPV